MEQEVVGGPVGHWPRRRCQSCGSPCEVAAPAPFFCRCRRVRPRVGWHHRSRIRLFSFALETWTARRAPAAARAPRPRVGAVARDPGRIGGAGVLVFGSPRFAPRIAAADRRAGDRANVAPPAAASASTADAAWGGAPPATLPRHTPRRAGARGGPRRGRASPHTSPRRRASPGGPPGGACSPAAARRRASPDWRAAVGVPPRPRAPPPPRPWHGGLRLCRPRRVGRARAATSRAGGCRACPRRCGRPRRLGARRGSGGCRPAWLHAAAVGRAKWGASAASTGTPRKGMTTTGARLRLAEVPVQLRRGLLL